MLKRWMRENLPVLVRKAREYLQAAQPGTEADQLNEALAQVRNEYQRGAAFGQIPWPDRTRLALLLGQEIPPASPHRAPSFEPPSSATGLRTPSVLSPTSPYDGRLVIEARQPVIKHGQPAIEAG